MSTQGFGQKIWSKETLMGRWYHIFSNTVQTVSFKKEPKIGGVWLVCDEVGINVHFIYVARMLRLVVMYGWFVTS